MAAIKKSRKEKNRIKQKSQKGVIGENVSIKATQKDLIGNKSNELKHHAIKKKIDIKMEESIGMSHKELELKELRLELNNQVDKSAFIIRNSMNSLFNIVISLKSSKNKKTITLKTKRGMLRGFKTIENASKIVEELGFKTALINY